ncbi:MAG TPA: response regulator, partial [Burkholderiales bacterium]|nr:response regulator [Burkholderiales bacterium]
MNILIVDDHASNLKQLRAQLEMESHTVLEAANGVEALQVLERESVGAVISDTLMPNMDGFRLCREIRKSEKFNSLPFILYTSAYTSPEDRQLAKLVGADRYVVKPAPARAIFDALHDAANKVRLGAPVDSTQDESYVLRPYSETLVDKLEEKNAELQETLRKLQAAHREIVALNRELELRVEQR